MHEVIIWSDSEAALQWIRNNNSKIPYVQNRVSNIREIGSSFQFLHVPNKENPADLLTRGISIKQFKGASIWMCGPLWLPHSECWPKQKSTIVVGEIVSEMLPDLAKVEPIFDYTNYSTLKKLLDVTKFVFRFIKICRPNVSLPQPIVYWIQIVQKIHYPRSYSFLCNKVNVLDQASKQFIKDLGLYLDEPTGLIERQGPQHEWPLGRIVELFPDAENIVRSVDVLCEGSVSKRTLDKLVPLEIIPLDDNLSPLVEKLNDENRQPVTANKSDSQIIRPLRCAAREAARVRKELIANQQL